MMDVEVVVPEKYVGEVISGFSSRRGRIRGMETRASVQIISADLPLANMFGYATDLRSGTQGRATFSMQFDRYEKLPESVSEEIIANL
jgi:elongation factor G